MSTPLESLQRIFAESLETEERSILMRLQGAPRGFDHAQPCSISDTVADKQVMRDSRADLEDKLSQRVDLYQSSIRGNRRKALASAYPTLLALVGDTYFDHLCLDYARAHPSRSGDLNRFGASLPAFIEAYEPDPRFRYFADLARLEWSLHLAYFAADVEALTRDEWAAIRPEDLLDAKLAVHPACALVSSPYAVGEVWCAHQPGGCFPADLDSPTYALVVRPMWQPQIRVQGVAAQAAFGALQRGATLNAALDAAFAVDAGFDFTAQWRAWVEASAFTGLAHDAPSPEPSLTPMQ